jgi:phenylacetate 2-hydroxylase
VFLDHIGVDMSGSPMTEQISKCRTAALVCLVLQISSDAVLTLGQKALGKPMWSGYFPLIEHNAVSFVKALYEKGENGKKVIEIYPWLRQIMLDLTLNLTYGARAGDFDDAFMNKLLNSLYAIKSVQGSIAVYRDFIPILRVIPKNSNNVMDAVKERQRSIDIFYGQYLQKFNDAETPTYIVSSLGADKLFVNSHFLVVHISTTIHLICWFPFIMSTCGAASPLILVFGIKADMVF